MFFTILAWVGLFVSGLILGGIITVTTKVKKTRKAVFFKAREKRSRILKENQKTIEQIIKTQCKTYKKANRFNVFRTVVGLDKKKTQKSYASMYSDIINQVASIYNENSEKPFLEFTISQAFDFIDGVVDDLQGVLVSLDMPILYNLDISTIYGVYDFGKRVNNLDIVKKAKKTGKVISKILKVLRIINPVRFIVGLINSVFSASLTRDLIFASAEITAWEFAFLYSTKADNSQIEVA